MISEVFTRAKSVASLLFILSKHNRRSFYFHAFYDRSDHTSSRAEQVLKYKSSFKVLLVVRRGFNEEGLAKIAIKSWSVLSK